MVKVINAEDENGNVVAILPSQVVGFTACGHKDSTLIYTNGGFTFTSKMNPNTFGEGLIKALRGFGYDI